MTLPSGAKKRSSVEKDSTITSHTVGPYLVDWMPRNATGPQMSRCRLDCVV